MMPTGQARSAGLGDPVDLGEFPFDLGRGCPAGTPRRPATGVPTRRRPAAGRRRRVRPPADPAPAFPDRRRNGDREVTGGERLQDGVLVPGGFGCGQCLGRQVRGALSATVLRIGDGELRQQAGADHRVGHPWMCQGALAQSADNPVHLWGADPVNHQPGCGEKIRSTDPAGEFRGLTQVLQRAADVGARDCARASSTVSPRATARRRRVGPARRPWPQTGSPRRRRAHCRPGRMLASPRRAVVPGVRPGGQLPVGGDPAGRGESHDRLKASALRRCHAALALGVRSA